MRPAAWIAFSVPIGVVGACGSRTGLLVPPPEHDATAPDVAEEVPGETDVIEEPEAALDADADAAEAEEDAPPMIEETVDVCPDAGSTLVYVMTQQNVLMSFYPPTATFTTIGTLQCPDPGNIPFSMAVDRAGIAYVLFESGRLYRVSTRTAVCVPTTFAPGQGFPPQFGMGFSANETADGGGDAGETLYIASDPGWMTGTPGPSSLGTLDTATYSATNVAAFTPAIEEPELTGTGAGNLYAFWAPTATSPASIVEIDKTTGAVTTLTTLPGIFFGAGWAFAFWGGDFYTFTAPQGAGSIVTRYRPSDGSIVNVATTPLTIVGAGVSTCAPQM